MIVLFLAFAAASCGGGKSPSSPSSAPPATSTRIISVSGDLAFGNVNIGENATRTFTIANGGNAALTFTSLTASTGTGSTGFAATPTSGTVQPGSSLPVTLRFTPTVAQYYSHVLSVVGDQTGGNPAINVSGFGIDNSPLFIRSGVGDNVFDIPTKVKRIRIDATYSGSCQNFIVRISTSTTSLVNVIIGTCSVADTRSPFSGTYAINSGGTVTITSSTGVAWTFTEVR